MSITILSPAQGQRGLAAEIRPLGLAAIASGGSSGVVLLTDGTVQAWGVPTGFYNRGGNLWMNSNVPVPVPEVRDAIAVSPYLFLLADGTVRTIESPGKPADEPALRMRIVEIAQTRVRITRT